MAPSWRADKRTSAARGYSSRWQAARKTFLAHHPLCVICARLGRTTAASVVDHVRAHRGDQSLFWDRSNWQPLCKPCHDRKTGHDERIIGCDADGFPIDPNHPWAAR